MDPSASLQHIHAVLLSVVVFSEAFTIILKKIRPGAKTKRPVKSQTAKICSSNEKSTYFAPVSFLSLVNFDKCQRRSNRALKRFCPPSSVQQGHTSIWGGGGALGGFSIEYSRGIYPEISLGTVRP